MKYNLDEYIGKKFNKLTIIKEVKNDKLKTYVLCQCDCGSKKEMQMYNVIKGNSKSCGSCKYKGHYNSRIRITYTHMIDRCYNTNNKSYKTYGARGIEVCDDWINDFLSFYKWAMNNGYADNLTIDRIDNSKGYSPENCRWVNMKTQQNNRTNNFNINYKGVTKTLTEWSRILDINYNTLRTRLLRDNKSIDEAFEYKEIKENINE